MCLSSAHTFPMSTANPTTSLTNELERQLWLRRQLVSDEEVLAEAVTALKPKRGGCDIPTFNAITVLGARGSL